MAKRRNLGHISAHHAMKSAVVKFIDDNDITGSLPEVTSVWEYRLDVIEDETSVLHSRITDVSSSVDINTIKIHNLNSEVISNADAVISLDIGVSNVAENVASNDQDIITINDELTTVITDVNILSSSISSSVSALSSDIYASNLEISSLSSSLASLSSSFALLSASIGPGGNLNVNIPNDAELYFNGDTLMTDAAVYISGSGNNLYLHGTNEQGLPAKYEFSITGGKTVIKEVPHSDFGEEVDDPWFKFDGDTLLTHADIYVSGSNNYLYLNGTDENGEYAIYYFDIVDGEVIIEQTGSIN
tara:strand:+ start:672 stop:1577 length:906 start_codon:yes stop_codon:yes gene_type:complete